jgi:hypothetical protein
MLTSYLKTKIREKTYNLDYYIFNHIIAKITTIFSSYSFFLDYYFRLMATECFQGNGWLK